MAQVKVKPNMAILSLICNVERTSEILMRTFKVLIEEGINVSMMSQGASKVGGVGICGVMVVGFAWGASGRGQVLCGPGAVWREEEARVGRASVA